MTRNVIPDYYPDQCIGCETLGEVITDRRELLDNLGFTPTRKQIIEAAMGCFIASSMCHKAELECPGISEICMYDQEYKTL